MKIIRKHRKTKIEQRKKWHTKFVILPKNLPNDELHFLYYLSRKLHKDYTFSRDFLDRIFDPMWALYEYKTIQDCITEKLMNK